MSDPQSAASIIVPTYREAANLRPLIERVFAAVRKAGMESELILVDDNSQDGSEELVESLKSSYPVRLIVRKTERGLSSAVLAGFGEARYGRLLVLDADLQHPPELIPDLLNKLDDPKVDFVIGTRYAGGGKLDPNWPKLRQWISRLATHLARPLAPLSDPMSGFFALRKDAWLQATNVSPIGYKIALELYVKSGCRNPAEVPIQFAPRTAGKTKFGSKEGFRFLKHLWRLYRYRFPLATCTAVFLVSVFVVSTGLYLFRRWI
ncbi:MAG: polyprenol monophosphomannose synthase [Planctomycetota bacterium]